MTASIPESAGIFISYRREDAAYPAGWLFDYLNGHFSGRVFKDVDSIQLGDDFVAEITAAVESCAVLLAVIGKQWLTVTDEEGRRRLDDPADFVRLEIEAAFTRDVRVIPILVDGARMPPVAKLPASLQKLVRRQALELSPNRFSSDTNRLLRVLDTALMRRIQPETSLADAGGGRGSGTGQVGTSGYLGRDEDLERMLRGFSNPAGPCFCLVISPPGLGKSWFLEQLAAKAAESASGGWVTRILDLRQDEADSQRDAMIVVRRFFGIEEPQSSGSEDDVRRVAQKIIRTGRSWLCLLDSAELLSVNAVAQLRQHLSRIFRLIQDAHSTDARLAFVVASRRDDGWMGITPYPSLSILPLAGFGPSAVQDALEGLARRTARVHSSAELRKDAEFVQCVTEGVPGLVQQSLRWIQAEEWLEIERLDSPQLFDEIIAPYIRDCWLTQDSLLLGEEGQPQKSAKQLDALRAALRILVPYRFFTLYHVHHCRDIDRSFRDALEEANWSSEDLWHAIADMALLRRPLDEPWYEIHPAVRRLLYRYFYAPDERAEAHRRARDLTYEWATRLTGKEQVMGLVEAIWHEAVRLRLSSFATMGVDLISFARTLSGDVRSSTYTKAALRGYAAQLMVDDDELHREVAGVRDLFEALVGVVEALELPGADT
jgi:TIR domain